MPTDPHYCKDCGTLSESCCGTVVGRMYAEDAAKDRATIARLSAEVERLRGALTQIANLVLPHGAELWDAKGIARAALAPQQADATGGEAPMVTRPSWEAMHTPMGPAGGGTWDDWRRRQENARRDSAALPPPPASVTGEKL